VLRPPIESAQYTSIRFTEHLALAGIRPSISSVGDAFDNALMETIISLFKTECIRTTVFHNGPYKTLADIEYATAGWVDWYDNRRLHSTLGMSRPSSTSKPTTLPSSPRSAHMRAARNLGRFSISPRVADKEVLDHNNPYPMCSGTATRAC